MQVASDVKCVVFRFDFGQEMTMASGSRIDIGKSVKSSDGKHVGDVDWLVIDGRTNKVEYLVIDKKVYSNGRLVPIGQVASSDEHGVVLSITADELKTLPVYDEVQMIQFRGPVGFGGTAGGVSSISGGGEQWFVYGREAGQHASTGTPPLFRMAPIGGVASQSVTSVSESDVALSEGTRVIDSTGDKIGRVDEVLFDDDLRISGLIVKTGRLRHKGVRINQEWIAGIAHDHIRLNVTREQVMQQGKNQAESKPA
jgi:sporulation protein YlmC with PRC-barrel domain